ncbi:NUDIX domain-containing protein [Pseudomonas sp. NFIX10]|uniref:NUDIX hydrolase n=1 Tax=unclassified Pseudomonas TaxID=196821 RepID=UPI0008DFD305|nr:MULTISPECIES: NUDIX hydrolase [unclassified Pseudomonas]SFB56710.1 NUDIX domain-containing protein [Pseudomonas sp. NFIX10]SFF48877.1 NUDIX domain-containing protein [Pseudomonas sp. NFACC06-1]
MSAQRIRPLVLCIFHHHGKILVNQFYDANKNQTLFRPIGGGIEFGERSRDAIIREVQEELGASISDLRLIGTLESIFTYAGKPGHEIVQVYDATFDDADLYEKTWLEGFESDGASFRATWCSSACFTALTPLVPEGLYDLLKSASFLE